MTVRAGRLRERIEVFKLTEERDEFGSLIKKTASVGLFWAEADNTKNIVIGNDIRQSQNIIQFTTRYNKAISQPNNKMFIRFRGADYDINSVINPRMLNEYLVITATLRGE